MPRGKTKAALAQGSSSRGGTAALKGGTIGGIHQMVPENMGNFPLVKG